jgi:hypothetical protein
MTDPKPDALTDDERSAIKSRAAEWLLRIPGVVGVGLGSKEVAGQPTPLLAIKVFVRVKRPLDEIPIEERIPAEIEGLPTDIVLGGDKILLADPPGAVVVDDHTDDTRFRPLMGGGRIGRAGSDYTGTMGCVVRSSDSSRFYVLTNYHVVAPPDVPAPVIDESEVGQPTGSSSMSSCCDDLIGKFVGGGKTDERDEALIRLAPGTQFRPEIIDVGPIVGQHPVTQGEALPGTYKVRKHGARTLLTGGTIRALELSTHFAENELVIFPNANPSAGGRPVDFAEHGDSGSVVVNDAAEVVGLVYAIDAAHNTYAFTVGNVLSRLLSEDHLTVAIVTAAAAGTVVTVPGAAMVTVPPEVVPVLEESLQPAGVGVALPEPLRVPVTAGPFGGLGGHALQPEFALAAVQRDLDRSESGRLLITLWLRHQEELVRLINTNRRVATVWHRSGAAALIGVLARMIGRPEVTLPETLHGRPLSRSLDQMHEVLVRFASKGLKDDLERARQVLPDPAGMTYPQLIDALGSG